MTLTLLLIAAGLAAFSGMPGLLLPRRWNAGQWIAVALMEVGCVGGLVMAIAALIEQTRQTLTLPGILPDWPFHLRVDPLTAFFLVPVFLIGAAASIYGLRYWRQSEHARNAKKVNLCYGLLASAMAMVTLSADGVTLLFTWEIMALSAFFLVSAEDQKAEARRAGWVYLIATHFGTLALFALFALLRMTTGSFELRAVQSSEAGAGLQALIFLLALLGFGIKAGAMPLHFWLPGAHANAPSHVSAIMSGVLLKIGIYGIVRTALLLPGLPVACGLLVLVIGAISAVLGVAFALGQHDLKRLLAYHSIENIGIILIGLGIAMMGAASGRTVWLVLGLAGCLLHVWNHCLFKSLLFFAAGSVVHAAETREIDRLGGLAKMMPKTAGLFAIGAIAICGLPPLNGFVSELLIYLGLFRAVTDAQSGYCGVAVAAPALAMVGALAVACFVKALGAVFLGSPRTSAAEHAHESPTVMLAPMGVLALLCAVIGVFPIIVLPLLDRVIVLWPGFAGPRLGEITPTRMVSALAILLIAAVALGVVLIRRQKLAHPVRAFVTWDCGYIRPQARMQYTSSSFASTLVALFGWVLRPQVHRTAAPQLFPAHSSFESHVPEVVLDNALIPFWHRVKARFARVRIFQQGPVQLYVLYILLAVFALLLSMVPVVKLWMRLIGRDGNG